MHSGARELFLVGCKVNFVQEDPLGASLTENRRREIRKVFAIVARKDQSKWARDASADKLLGYYFTFNRWST
jgi:hypothetical protein